MRCGPPVPVNSGKSDGTILKYQHPLLKICLKLSNFGRRMTVGLRKRCFLINEKPSRSIALEERKSKQNAEPIQFADKRKQTYRRQKAFIAGPKWRKKSIHFGIVYLLKKPDKSIEIPCLMATCLV